MLPWNFLMLFPFLVSVITSNPTHREIQKREVDDTCAPEPCQKAEEICHDNKTNTFACSCPQGFPGMTDCSALNEINVDVECTTEPCRNGGTICYDPDDDTAYSCICSPGYTGSNCENVVHDTCVPEPCRNGGSICHGDTTNTFSCICSAGYTGNHCEIAVP